MSSYAKTMTKSNLEVNIIKCLVVVDHTHKRKKLNGPETRQVKIPRKLSKVLLKILRKGLKVLNFCVREVCFSTCLNGPLSIGL